MTFQDLFHEFADQCGLPVTPELIDASDRYLRLLQKWQARISLMSDRSVSKQLRFHLFESFWAAHHFMEDDCRVADIGSGAGFPGLAATLYRPTLQTVLLESNQKKTVFLQTAARSLELPVRVVADRAENFDQWASIDLATARAIVPSAILLKTLENSSVDLLLFHGNEGQTLSSSWKCLEKQLFPLSSNRWVSRFSTHSS